MPPQEIQLLPHPSHCQGENGWRRNHYLCDVWDVTWIGGKQRNTKAWLLVDWLGFCLATMLGKNWKQSSPNGGENCDVKNHDGKGTHNLEKLNDTIYIYIHTLKMVGFAQLQLLLINMSHVFFFGVSESECIRRVFQPFQGCNHMRKLFFFPL